VQLLSAYQLELEGILIYRGNRLVRRLEGQIGSEERSEPKIETLILMKRPHPESKDKETTEQRQVY